MNSNKSIPVWAIVLLAVTLLVGGLALSFIHPYNKIVSLQSACETEQANIQTQLQAKIDKISQMLPQVEAVVNKDSSLSQSINSLSDQLSGVKNLPGKASLSQLENADNVTNSILKNLTQAFKTDNSLSQGVISDYMIVVEGIENRLAVARRDYNKAVGVYNSYIRGFPHNIVAGLFGFDKIQPFQAESD